MRIIYRAGYKYQLLAPVAIVLPHGYPGVEAMSMFFSLKGSILSIREGYAWDGPSGPTIDTANFMRGSLAHDALYQAMREGRIDDSHENRLIADENLRAICLEDGMSQVRAWWVFQGVRVGGASSAARGERPVRQAP